MDEASITHVFTVRDRPVGFRPGRWGGALVAVERGYFPVSHTGYRSLAGQSGGQELPSAAITADFLERLATEREREQQTLLQRVREAKKPVGQPIQNYVHVSSAFELAVQHGFFATDGDRAALWAGAHQLLCLVDADRRFQPTPHASYPAWTEPHCTNALQWSRELGGLLTRLAAGEFPSHVPQRLAGVLSYVRLPPKAGGEPKIELGGFTAEMALSDGASEVASPRQGSRRAQPVWDAGARPPDTQLGLFDEPAAGSPPAQRMRM